MKKNAASRFWTLEGNSTKVERKKREETRKKQTSGEIKGNTDFRHFISQLRHYYQLQSKQGEDP